MSATARGENFASPGGVVADEPSRLRHPRSGCGSTDGRFRGTWTIGQEAAALERAPAGGSPSAFMPATSTSSWGRRRRALPCAFGSASTARRRARTAASTSTKKATGRSTEQRLYQLVRQQRPIVDRTFEIEFLDPGVEAFVFTFG